MKETIISEIKDILSLSHFNNTTYVRYTTIHGTSKKTKEERCFDITVSNGNDIHVFRSYQTGCGIIKIHGKYLHKEVFGSG